MAKLMIGSAMAAAGYLLLYASVADGGKYVLRPWDGFGA